MILLTHNLHLRDNMNFLFAWPTYASEIIHFLKNSTLLTVCWTISRLSMLLLLTTVLEFPRFIGRFLLTCKLLLVWRFLPLC